MNGFTGEPDRLGTREQVRSDQPKRTARDGTWNEISPGPYRSLDQPSFRPQSCSNAPQSTSPSSERGPPGLPQHARFMSGA